jgi:hypothetical protein
MRPPTKTGLLAGALLIAAATPGAAQETELVPGSRLQIQVSTRTYVPGLDPSLDPPRFTGKLVAIEDDRLRIARKGEKDLLLSPEQIERIEVSRGRDPFGHRVGAGAKKGAMIGGVAGVFAILPIGLWWCDKGVPCPGGDVVVATLTSVVALGTAGGAVGAIGGAASHGERWETVEHRRPRLSLDLATTRRGAGVAVKYAF